MNLGVITDGISRELQHAVEVMNEFHLEYAELQFVGEKEVGDFSLAETAEIRRILEDNGKKVPCVSRHNFSGVSVGDITVGDARYNKFFDGLKRSISCAQELTSPLVRIMSFRKEMILFGSNGVEHWNVAKGAWDKCVALFRPIVDYVEKEGVQLVVETGNNAIITSTYLGRRLIDELQTDNLQVLWDPGNSLFCNEQPYPDGYGQIRGKYLGHIHMKDVFVNIPHATVGNRQMGTGDMAPYFVDLAAALRRDKYQGVVCYESVYHPGNGNYEEGFRASFPLFKQIFGNHSSEPLSRN